MQVLWIVVGAALITLALVDAIATTLFTATRAGPLTRVMTQSAWRLVLAVHHRRPNHRVLTGVGPFFLVAGLVQWIVLLWLGWVAIFTSDPSGLISSDSRAPVSVADRVYFAGMALFTLGTGDIVAAGPTWRLVSVLASATGLFLVTLSLSYFISVMGAATDRRVLAARLHALGDSPQAVLLNAWHNGAFSPQLTTALSTLAEPIARFAEQHMSNHVLHYFHTRHPSRSVILGLARLDEALTLLDIVHHESRPDPFVREQVRDHLSGMLEVVGQAHQTFPATDGPPAPAHELLHASGVPLGREEQVTSMFEDLHDRRRRMAAMVVSDGWRWEEV